MNLTRPTAFSLDNVPAGPENVQRSLTPFSRLRKLIERPEIAFLMESHNGLSAKIAEEAGFEGLWASGLTISASLGLRDSNEASWTQVLDILEYMVDATSLPILVDGDTGYGNFNNVRRLVRKLCERQIAGVCIEDKLFPKTNSFIGEHQPLADIDEFCGRLKAGKDSQSNDDFVIVARVEALISGRQMSEALKRAEAYRAAGADAILIHSKQATPHEILAFTHHWADRAPLVIVPTMYYGTPTEVFEKARISTVIWANHLLRSAIAAMRTTAARIKTDRSLVETEDSVASVRDIFSLVGNAELEAAEKRYLPSQAAPRTVILAASQGNLDSTVNDSHLPKCMADVRGQPLLCRLVDTIRKSGLRDITVVRGFGKEAVNLPGVRCVDNSRYAETGELYSLNQARALLEGELLVAYGDTLFRKFILDTLLETEGDIVLAVDGRGVHGQTSRKPVRDLIVADRGPQGDGLDEVPAKLLDIGRHVPADAATGEWVGLARFSPHGTRLLCDAIDKAESEGRLETADLPSVITAIAAQQTVLVHYFDGHWIDVDNLRDLAIARNFI